jgi:hypothetical protein
MWEAHIAEDFRVDAARGRYALVRGERAAALAPVSRLYQTSLMVLLLYGYPKKSGWWPPPRAR